MLKITTLLLLSVCIGCGGGQKPDDTSSDRSAGYPLPDENAPAAKSAQPPAAKGGSGEANRKDYNEGKKAPTDEQKDLLKQAEADLAGMVEKICACKDKACLETLQTEFQAFGVKYKGLEDIQIPKDSIERMMLLGQRVTECTQSIAGS